MRTRIKICGITTPEDAVTASRAGADYLGVVLTDSPRRVSRERVLEIARASPAGAIPAGAPLVGVFAAEPPEAVARIAADLPLHAVQVSGWIGIEHGL
ncbi:MAG: hypothetical protein HY568_06930, partial [Candidatus Latescibacteria bacterium]|nr:hypothetical protein [Candidatus Latescibacterota bacterium]